MRRLSGALILLVAACTAPATQETTTTPGPTTTTLVATTQTTLPEVCPPPPYEIEFGRGASAVGVGVAWARRASNVGDTPPPLLNTGADPPPALSPAQITFAFPIIRNT